ncbi:MAG TPA: hypothetical protein VGG28_30440 [Kofleriaceae bacterium]|jgi:hypothetical protein
MRCLALCFALAGCATVGAQSPDSMLRQSLESAPHALDLAHRATALAQSLAQPATSDRELAAALHAEVVTVGGLVVADVASAGSPLASEAREQTYAALLARPELADRATAIRASIHDAGVATCNALDASTPYASRLASRYCAHFGITRVALALPDRFGSIVVDGDVASDDRAATTTALDAALRASPWFAAGAPPLHATITGTIDAEMSGHPVTRTATWTDDETYTGSVKTWEPHDGFVDEPIELHREVPRSLDYAATERTGTYSSALHVAIEPLGVGASEAAAFTRSGDDTDIDNADAGVTPTRAELPTLANFWVGERAALADHVRAALARAFQEGSCDGSGYEAAAACAYVDPTAAAPMLAGTFGADAALLATVLR